MTLLIKEIGRPLIPEKKTVFFTLEINKSGNVFGLRNNTDHLGGKVYEGGVLMNLHSPPSGFVINGNLETKSGTWKMVIIFL